MNASRRIDAPQRAHGIPAWPYAASERLKYPEAPLTST